MFGGLLWIVGIIAAVWVLVDVWTKRGSMDQTQKIIWTIAAVIFSVITAIVYYFVVVNKK